MSNCIDFVAPARTSAANFDMPRMFEAINKAEKDSIPWWFLQGIVIDHTGEELIFNFGRGQSMHTNRDFNATLIYLSQFIKQSFVLEVVTTDEYDGFKAKALEHIFFDIEKGVRRPIGGMDNFEKWPEVLLYPCQQTRQKD